MTYQDPMASSGPMPGRYVECGKGLSVCLCHRVALVRGVGQIWHSVRPHGYVLVSLDATGASRFSWIEDVATLMRHFGLPVRNLGISPADAQALEAWKDISVSPLADLLAFLDKLKDL